MSAESTAKGNASAHGPSGIELTVICFLAVATLAAVFAQQLAPYDPVADMDFTHVLQPPSAEHWLGTDDYGRDVLSRLLYGVRASLSIAALVVLVASVAGTALGLVGGYYRGWIDSGIMRLVDTLMAYPTLLLAIAIIGIAGPGTVSVVVALSITYLPRFIRLIRGGALSLGRVDFVQAAHALGATPARTIGRHLFPNVVHLLITQASIYFAYAILAEAALSFLGLGVPAPYPSLGGMLDAGRRYMHQAPLLSVIPGAVISLLVLAINVLGDSLRDRLDPRVRKS